MFQEAASCLGRDRLGGGPEIDRNDEGNSMRNTSRRTLVTLAALVLGGIALLSTGAVRGRNSRVERVDFGVTRTAVSPVWDARVRPASEAGIKEFRIPMTHDTIEVSKGVRYVGWTFGATVPGPVIRVRQGDLVRITLVNQAKDMPHSIDFHASKIPMDHAMKSIAPGDSLQFEFEATTAGVFMVHCGTPPVLMHIAQGMYLPIIVDPKGGAGSRLGGDAGRNADVRRVQREGLPVSRYPPPGRYRRPGPALRDERGPECPE